MDSGSSKSKENSPFASALVPVEVPFTKIVDPGSGAWFAP